MSDKITDQTHALANTLREGLFKDSIELKDIPMLGRPVLITNVQGGRAPYFHIQFHIDGEIETFVVAINKRY